MKPSPKDGLMEVVMRSSLLRLSLLMLSASALALFGRSETSGADAPLTPEDAITRLFNGEPQAEWFAPAFLSQVPIDQVKAIVAQYKAQLGALQSVRANGSAYEMTFEHGSARATIRQDASGAITSLLFGTPTSNDRGGETAGTAIAQEAAREGEPPHHGRRQRDGLDSAG